MSILSLFLLPLVCRYLLELAFSSAGHSVSPYGLEGLAKPHPQVRLAYEEAPRIMHMYGFIVKGDCPKSLRS